MDPESSTTLWASQPRKETFSYQHTQVDYALRLRMGETSNNYIKELIRSYSY